MITAIATAEKPLDFNTNLRNLLNQHRSKKLDSLAFINAYNQLLERAKECEMVYHTPFNTFAPIAYPAEQIGWLKMDADTDLMELEDINAAASLLRSGSLDISDTEWQLRMHFVHERASELGFFWNSETKKFK